MNKFKVGDVVKFLLQEGLDERQLKSWNVSKETLYTILSTEGDSLVEIKQDDGTTYIYNTDYFQLCGSRLVAEVQATAWKIGDVEFIREGQNVNIFGMGEISLPISTLKTILETLEAN